MRLSELSTDRAADVLCELTPYINNIITDENLKEQISGKIKLTGGETKAEIVAMGIEKINKLVPIILKSHKDDTFGIIAAVNETTVDEIKSQNVLKTMAQIKAIVKVREEQVNQKMISNTVLIPFHQYQKREI